MWFRGKIFANIFILETEYKLKSRHTIKTEIQHLQTKQHFGNWGMGMIELLNLEVFLSSRLIQLRTPNSANHYYSGNNRLVKDSHRIELRYGKVRAGLFCVGGVCRVVPASNGFSINFTYSF